MPSSTRVLAAAVVLTGWMTGCDGSNPPPATGVPPDHAPAVGASSLTAGAGRGATGPSVAPAASRGTGSAATHEEDTRIEADLREKKAEARAWLADPKNRLFKGDHAQTEAFVRRVYELGAPEVFATNMVDIDQPGKGEFASTFVVVLPKDAKSRAAIVSYYNNFVAPAEEELDDDERAEVTFKDNGQKYLELIYD